MKEAKLHALIKGTTQGSYLNVASGSIYFELVRHLFLKWRITFYVIRWWWEAFCQTTRKIRNQRSQSLTMHQLMSPLPLQCLLRHPLLMVKRRMSWVDTYCTTTQEQPLTRTFLLPRPFVEKTGLTCTPWPTRWSWLLTLTYLFLIVKLMINLESRWQHSWLNSLFIVSSVVVLYRLLSTLFKPYYDLLSMTP